MKLRRKIKATRKKLMALDFIDVFTRNYAHILNGSLLRLITLPVMFFVLFITYFFAVKTIQPQFFAFANTYQSYKRYACGVGGHRTHVQTNFNNTSTNITNIRN